MKSKEIKILFIVLILSILLIVPELLLAKEDNSKNTGFISNPLWYSDNSFFDGDEIKIYTVIFNSYSKPLKGIIEFYDGKDLLKSKDFRIKKEKTEVVFIEWKATKGEHNIFAKIIDSKIIDDGQEKKIQLKNTQTMKNKIEIDLDTDKDGIGNREDLDDDNDGLLDSEEIKLGTNPLKKDSNGNGINDKVESQKINANGLPLSLLNFTQKVSEDGSYVQIIATGSMADTSKELFQKVEKFRNSQKKKIEKKIPKIKEKIKQIKEQEIKIKENQKIKDKNIKQEINNQALVLGVEKPLNYIYLFFMSALDKFLQYKSIFYSSIFVASFYSIKTTFSRIFRRVYKKKNYYYD